MIYFRAHCSSSLKDNDVFLLDGGVEHSYSALPQPSRPACVHIGMVQGHELFQANSGTNGTSVIIV